MDKETKQALNDMNVELGRLSNTMGDFNKLLSNHITDYGYKFDTLRRSVDMFKLWLILITMLVVIALGGFVAMAVTLLIRLLTT